MVAGQNRSAMMEKISVAEDKYAAQSALLREVLARQREIALAVHEIDDENSEVVQNLTVLENSTLTPSVFDPGEVLRKLQAIKTSFGNVVRKQKEGELAYVKMQVELGKLRNKNVEIESISNELRSELDRAANSYEMYEEQLRKRAEVLNSKVEGLTLENVELKDENEALKEKITELMREIEALRAPPEPELQPTGFVQPFIGKKYSVVSPMTLSLGGLAIGAWLKKELEENDREKYLDMARDEARLDLKIDHLNQARKELKKSNTARKVMLVSGASACVSLLINDLLLKRPSRRGYDMYMMPDFRQGSVQVAFNVVF